MTKNRLWAPWRIKYIRKIGQGKCIFCRARRESAGELVIFKTRYTLCMLNAFPYNNGHVMIAPLRHVKNFLQLKDKEALDLFNSINKATKLLDRVLRPHGYNIGINLSRVAGAGITGHMHIHIVPRWKGDSNFMPVLFDTKVVSQSLRELQKQLKHAESKSN